MYGFRAGGIVLKMWSRLLRPSSIRNGHLPIASARLYHSKTGVYGYNAPLHDQTKEGLASVEGVAQSNYVTQGVG